MNLYAPAPDPRQWRRRFYAACVAIPFTLTQLWAVAVVLSTASFQGAAAIAFPLAIGGMITAVLSGWRWMWKLGRENSERRRPS